MKQNKLFNKCLTEVNPNVRQEVRNNMEKIRVNKGEKYWWISSVTSLEICVEIDFQRIMDDMRFDNGNYFNTKEGAELIACKFRAVLNSADVYTQEEITEIKANAFADGMEAERRKSKNSKVI